MFDIITTIAGTGSTGYNGDGGAATSSTLSFAWGVALDSSGAAILSIFNDFFHNFLILGDIYIADYGNHRVRKVTVSTGIISSIAGTGTSSFSGDNGAATSATLSYPIGVALDSTGTIPQ